MLLSLRDEQCCGSCPCWDTPHTCSLSVLDAYSHLGVIKVQAVTFMMLSLGKSLLFVSFQTVLTCLRQDKVQTKAMSGNWAYSTSQVISELAVLQFVPGHVFTRKKSWQYRSLQMRTSWEQAETHFSLAVHTHQWVLITCGYHLPFSYFLSMSFLLATAVKSFPPLQCPR